MNIYPSQSDWDQFNQSISNAMGVPYTPMAVPDTDHQPVTCHVPWNKGKTGVQPSTRKGTVQGPMPAEQREKIRQSMLDATNAMEDPANRLKISAKLKGRTFSPEWRAKLKAASARRTDRKAKTG